MKNALPFMGKRVFLSAVVYPDLVVLEELVFSFFYFFFQRFELFFGFFGGVFEPVVYLDARIFAFSGGKKYAERRADYAAEHESRYYGTAFVF